MSDPRKIILSRAEAGLDGRIPVTAPDDETLALWTASAWIGWKWNAKKLIYSIGSRDKYSGEGTYGYGIDYYTSRKFTFEGFAEIELTLVDSADVSITTRENLLRALADPERGPLRYVDLAETTAAIDLHQGFFYDYTGPDTGCPAVAEWTAVENEDAVFEGATSSQIAPIAWPFVPALYSPAGGYLRPGQSVSYRSQTGSAACVHNPDDNGADTYSFGSTQIEWTADTHAAAIADSGWKTAAPFSGYNYSVESHTGYDVAITRVPFAGT